ncbi:type II secretion system protein GspM [Comamonas sp. NLF-1-9]|uniref:type II secretion system protein GspM n=1 Tax=Comamonas sp. NLF-1-9 TaxID=2853163 RepID=UPI001C46C34F|nr:type II secretion system protein GspM [Comamonas sp. NLF-1-9]QXL83552.1 type II secretion system protein M [Comamonas sp. NLF-1-9]
MKLRLHSDILLPAITLVCALGVVAAGAVYVFQKHQWVQSQLADTIEPRHARLAGLKESAAALASASARAGELESLYTHGPDQEANQIGNEVQQRVRGLLAGAGMTISSNQVLPSKEEGRLERIPLSVRAEGDIVALRGALAALAEQVPAVLLDTLDIQAQGAAEQNPQRLSVQFNFLILRRLGAPATP